MVKKIKLVKCSNYVFRLLSSNRGNHGNTPVHPLQKYIVQQDKSKYRGREGDAPNPQSDAPVKV